MKTKLNLGCGTDIRGDCVNVDRHPLEGVEIVIDLSKVPYPFRDGQFEEVYMLSILEHLPNTIQVLEEVHRIAKRGALVFVHVPYWNSYISIVDPTHIKSFHEKTFNFFDPSKLECKTRPYYSTARFRVKKIDFYTPFLGVIIKWRKENGINRVPEYLKVSNRALKGIVRLFAHYFCNVVQTMDVYLEVLKP